jgi:hypothetical protein
VKFVSQSVDQMLLLGAAEDALPWVDAQLGEVGRQAPVAQRRSVLIRIVVWCDESDARQTCWPALAQCTETAQITSLIVLRLDVRILVRRHDPRGVEHTLAQLDVRQHAR